MKRDLKILGVLVVACAMSAIAGLGSIRPGRHSHSRRPGDTDRTQTGEASKTSSRHSAEPPPAPAPSTQATSTTKHRTKRSPTAARH